LVARFVRDEEAVGSNPATPTANPQVRGGLPSTVCGSADRKVQQRATRGGWFVALPPTWLTGNDQHRSCKRSRSACPSSFKTRPTPAGVHLPALPRETRLAAAAQAHRHSTDNGIEKPRTEVACEPERPRSHVLRLRRHRRIDRASHSVPRTVPRLPRHRLQQQPRGDEPPIKMSSPHRPHYSPGLPPNRPAPSARAYVSRFNRGSSPVASVLAMYSSIRP
jgi:hypothetical protein